MSSARPLTATRDGSAGDLTGPPWARVLRVVGFREAARLLTSLGVADRELEHLRRCTLHRLIHLGPLPNPDARRLKRLFSHIGGEAAIPGHAYDEEGESDIILMGSLEQFDGLHRRLQVGIPELRHVGEAIELALVRDGGVRGYLKAAGYNLPVGGRTQVMGVLNVTPDSFSDGGRFEDPSAAIERGVKMVDEGADIIDVGGVSSRPGADEVSPEEELRRVLPVVEGLSAKIDIPISVDTSRAAVARAAVEAGASIVNDITALRGDPEMTGIVADSGCGVVLMHMRGTPKTMSGETDYGDVTGDVWRFLAERVVAAREAGIARESIVVDPGIGFAKTPEQNLTILRRLGEFRSLGVPLLIGTSRKSFIGAVLDLPVEERREGTDATVAWSVFQGAWAVRVHDVETAVRNCRMIDAIVTAP